jgi:hypothetical protein
MYVNYRLFSLVHFPIIFLNKKLCDPNTEFDFCYFFKKVTYLAKYCSGNGPPNTPGACQIVDITIVRTT